jgi:hypothetical protein
MSRKQATSLDRAEIRAAFLRAVLTLDPTEGRTAWSGAPRPADDKAAGDEPPPPVEDRGTPTP